MLGCPQASAVGGFTLQPPSPRVRGCRWVEGYIVNYPRLAPVGIRLSLARFCRL